METITMTYPEFRAIANKELAVKSYQEYLNVVLKFYLNNGRLNQNRTYIVEDLVNIDGNEKVISKETKEDKERYARFGIFFKSLELEEGITTGIDTVDREYIALLNKCPGALTTEYIESTIKTFCDENLPEGASPSWFIDLNSHTEYSSVVFVLNTIRESFPRVESLIYYGELKKTAIRDESINEDIDATVKQINEFNREKAITSKGKYKYEDVEYLDITDEVDTIHDKFWKVNNNTIYSFVNTMDTIGAKLKPNTLVIYYGTNGDDYVSAASYLTYFFKANCFIHTSERSKFFSRLGRMFYDPKTMLVEDRIGYLLRFPTYSFKTTDYTAAFIGTLARRVTGKIQLCSIQIDENEDFSRGVVSPESLQTILDFDFNKHEILPLLDHFDLESTELNLSKASETALKKLFIGFEEVINIPRDKLVDVTNTFFVLIGGEVCIAYLEEVNLVTKSHIVVDAMIEGNNIAGATNLNFSIKEVDVSTYFPMEILHCNDDAIKKIRFANPYFLPIQLQTKAGIEEPKQLKVVEAYKSASKYMIPLLHYCINPMLVPVTPMPMELFHDLGMYSPYTTAYRCGGTAKLLKQLNRSMIRKESNLFSVYGGYHPATSSTLTLTEKMLVNSEME